MNPKAYDELIEYYKRKADAWMGKAIREKDPVNRMFAWSMFYGFTVAAYEQNRDHAMRDGILTKGV